MPCKIVQMAMNPDGPTAEDDLGLSLAQTRPKEEDSKRTRILKECLRDTMDLHMKAQKEMPKPKPKKAAGPIAKPKGFSSNLPSEVKTVQNPIREAAEGLDQMSANGGDRLDELCAEFANDFELKVLNRSGKRISQLCDKLRDSVPATPPEGESRRGTEEVRQEGFHAEDSGGMSNMRLERLAMRYVSENVKFDLLEELDAAVAKANDFEDLRKLFPKKHVHHPNLVKLTDSTLLDPAEFRRVIWEPVPKDWRVPEEAPKPRRRSLIVMGRRSSRVGGIRTTIGSAAGGRSVGSSASSPLLPKVSAGSGR